MLNEAYQKAKGSLKKRRQKENEMSHTHTH